MAARMVRILRLLTGETYSAGKVHVVGIPEKGVSNYDYGSRLVGKYKTVILL